MTQNDGVQIRFGRAWRPEYFCSALYGLQNGVPMESRQAFEPPSWPEPWPSVFPDSSDGKMGALIEKWAREKDLKGTIFRSSPDAFQLVSRPEGTLLSSIGKKWGVAVDGAWLKALQGLRLQQLNLEKAEKKKLKNLRQLIGAWDHKDAIRGALGAKRCAWFEATWEDCAKLWPAPKNSRFKARAPKPKGWWIEFQLEVNAKHADLVPLALTPFFTIQIQGAPTIYGYSRRDQQRTWIRLRTLAPWDEETLSIAWQRKYMARALRAAYECIPGLQWCEPELKPDFSSDESQSLKRLYGYRKLDEIPEVLRVTQAPDPLVIVPLKSWAIAKWHQIQFFKVRVLFFWLQERFLNRTFKKHPCMSWFKHSQIKSWI